MAVTKILEAVTVALAPANRGLELLPDATSQPTDKVYVVMDNSSEHIFLV